MSIQGVQIAPKDKTRIDVGLFSILGDNGQKDRFSSVSGHPEDVVGHYPFCGRDGRSLAPLLSTEPSATKSLWVSCCSTQVTWTIQPTQPRQSSLILSVEAWKKLEWFGHWQQQTRGGVTFISFDLWLPSRIGRVINPCLTRTFWRLRRFVHTSWKGNSIIYSHLTSFTDVSAWFLFGSEVPQEPLLARLYASNTLAHFSTYRCIWRVHSMHEKSAKFSFFHFEIASSSLFAPRWWGIVVGSTISDLARSLLQFSIFLRLGLVCVFKRKMIFASTFHMQIFIVSKGTRTFRVLIWLSSPLRFLGVILAEAKLRSHSLHSSNQGSFWTNCSACLRSILHCLCFCSPRSSGNKRKFQFQVSN